MLESISQIDLSNCVHRHCHLKLAYVGHSVPGNRSKCHPSFLSELSLKSAFQGKAYGIEEPSANHFGPMAIPSPNVTTGIGQEDSTRFWRSSPMIVVLLQAVKYEFDRLRFSNIPSCDEAAKKENIRRNRYCDVLPYDFNRVHLASGEYINASYLQSKESDAAQWRYIATQASSATPYALVCKNLQRLQLSLP